MSQRVVKLPLLDSPTHTRVNLPTELSGMLHVSVLLILISRILLYPYFDLCTKRYALLTGSGATAHKVRLNVRVYGKNRCRLGREKFSEIWRMDDVELG